MADQVVTRRLCDLCLHDDVETDNAKRRPVTIDGVGYELDTCAEHGKTVDAFAAMLDEHARRVGKSAKPAPPSEEPVTCILCGTKLAHRASLSAHARQQHNMTLGELEGKATKYTCDVCDRAFTTPQGIAVHRRTHAK